MANEFYRQRVAEHLHIGLEAVRLLREQVRLDCLVLLSCCTFFIIWYCCGAVLLVRMLYNMSICNLQANKGPSSPCILHSVSLQSTVVPECCCCVARCRVSRGYRAASCEGLMSHHSAEHLGKLKQSYAPVQAGQQWCNGAIRSWLRG
jgi:hypothetical protein